MTDELPEIVIEPSFWQRIAKNAALQIGGRIAMLLTFGLTGGILAYETAQATALQSLSTRTSSLETSIRPLIEIATTVNDLSTRMTASETRGDYARSDRQKQTDLLAKISDVETQILQAIAREDQRYTDLDGRLTRLENKTN